MITIHPCKHLIKDDREEVTQAWYMDDSDEDQRLPHHRNPKEFVTLEKLAELVVLSWRLDDDNYETDAFRVSNLSHGGEGFWLWFCFVRGLVDYMPQVYIKEFSEVWKRFSQFEQTYGDLASMLKVEQRRKEAFCRTGEEGASALESSLQDVVSRYSFMDLWPCSSKDLDNLVWQEALQSDSS